MQKIGFGTFVAGIAIAISGGAKLPAEGAEWPTTVPVFLVGCVVALVGLVIWRRAVSAMNKAAALTVVEGKDAVSLLAGLIEPVKEFGRTISSMEQEAINQRADELLETWVLPFAEARQTIIQRFGMEEGADVLVTVAYGERMLNRVWSAAADGHSPEARACLPEAVAAFEEAHARVVALS